MIDTKKAREMRAAGTGGTWDADVTPNGPSGQICHSECVRSDLELIATRPSYDDRPRFWPANARLIAYAVNQITPMADEIDRLRAELQREREKSAVANVKCRQLWDQLYRLEVK